MASTSRSAGWETCGGAAVTMSHESTSGHSYPHAVSLVAPDSQPKAARAAVLAIGDELVLGAVSDRHARWLASRLVDMGATVVEHRTVGDDTAAIVSALRAFVACADVVLVTGGLGPTDDDLTREALSEVLGQPLVQDAEAAVALRQRYESRKVPMPSMNWKQATRPEGASCIANPHGTAPGLRADHAGTRVYAMPGPPREMHPMWDTVVGPEIRALVDARGGVQVRTHAIHSCGLPESVAAERIRAWMVRGSNPVMGTTASGAVVSARIRAEGPDAQAALDRAAAAVRTAWAPFAFGEGGTTLEAAVGAALQSQGARVAVAESCTGGLIGGALTSVAGSSAWFRGGIVAYENEVKVAALGVPAALIEREGAVSEHVARAMARGAAHRIDARWAVATTGVAGPGGGTEAKPVGTVWVAVHDRMTGAEDVRQFRFTGDRAAVRERTVSLALQMLRLAIEGTPAPSLLWEWRG